MNSNGMLAIYFCFALDIKLFYNCYLFSDKLYYKEKLITDIFSFFTSEAMLKKIQLPILFINCPRYFNLLMFCCCFWDSVLIGDLDGLTAPFLLF